jgi:hypothetical protein
MADGREGPGMRIDSVQKTASLLFFAILACYLALAPGTTEGRGYVPEDLNAGMGMLASFNAWVKGRPVPPIIWTRHGPIPLLFALPFIKAGKLFTTPDFMLSLQPVVATAGTMAIVYLWLSRLCTPGMSLLLTLIGAFGTMLWPYAYIGLETTQSFFVVLAGYLALGGGKIRNWPRLMFFSTICALAMSVKATGIVLGPAIAYLLYVQFRGEWRARWKQAAAVAGNIAVIWGVGAIGWNLYWAPKGGGASNMLQEWTTDSAFQIFTNGVGLFGSPGKGLFVFAPILLLVLYALPRVFRSHREIAIFALLVTFALVGLLSTLVVLADELWGPRFLHVCVAPLLVMIGAAIPRFQWRTLVPMVALGVIGVSISFLGAFYYYGARGWAATAAGQNTLEWFIGDEVWNEIQFDARLFGVWIQGGKEPAYWTPAHHWAWTPPADAPPLKTVNLREYADPQSFLLYYWHHRLEGSNLIIFRICKIALFVAPLLLGWVIARTIRTRAAARTAPPLVESPASDATFNCHPR